MMRTLLSYALSDAATYIQIFRAVGGASLSTSDDQCPVCLYGTSTDAALASAGLIPWLSSEHSWSKEKDHQSHCVAIFPIDWLLRGVSRLRM